MDGSEDYAAASFVVRHSMDAGEGWREKLRNGTLRNRTYMDTPNNGVCRRLDADSIRVGWAAELTG